MIQDLSKVRDHVLSAIKRWPLAERVDDVEVESGSDENGEDFLRIIIEWRPPQRDVDAELEALLERIEEEVSAIDERYPSIRFQDAA